MTLLPAWRRYLQPLLLTGLFCCWLLFGTIGWLWLTSGQRHAAQQALDDASSQQLASLQLSLDQLQLSARQLLRSLESARLQGDSQFLPYLANYRRQHPPLGQLALLAANPTAGRQLEILALTPFQSENHLLLGQDLARQAVVASALPALGRGQPQLLLWQRRSPEQWLLLLPGQHGLTLALWLQPQALLPEPATDGRRLLLTAQAVTLPAGLEGDNLYSLQALRSGAFDLKLSSWQPWQWQDVLGWRSLAWCLFMALLAGLGWMSYRVSHRLLWRADMAGQMQQQWLSQAEALAPVSVQGALATLERKAQLRLPTERLLVWWVHGKGARRRQFQAESVLFRLENQLVHCPFDGLQPMRLRHGGMLLWLLCDGANSGELAPRVSNWLTAVMGGRTDEAALLWLCFDISHDVQSLERALAEVPRLREPGLR